MASKTSGPSNVVKTTHVDSWYDLAMHSGAFPVTVFVESKVINGASVPNYKYKIANRQNASSSYSRVSSDMQSCNAFKIDGTRMTTPFWGSRAEWLRAEVYLSFMPDDPVLLSLTEAVQQSQRRFVQKAIAAQRSLAGGVVIGEIGKTIQMIISPANAIRSALRRYLERTEKYARKRRLRHGRVMSLEVPSVRKSVQEAVAGSWLETAFGIQPLLSDIDGAMKGLAEQVTGMSESVVRIGSTFSTTTATSIAGSYGVEAGWGDLKYFQRKINDVSVSYYGAIRIAPSNTLGGFNHRFGLQLADLPATIWELIPGSFLFDYWLNVGDILDAISVQTTDFVFLGQSTKKRTVTNLESVGFVHVTDSIPPKFVGTPLVTVTGGTCTGSRVVFTRSKIEPTALIPSLTFSIPGAGRKWVNMSALAAQAESASARILFDPEA